MAGFDIGCHDTEASLPFQAEVHLELHLGTQHQEEVQLEVHTGLALQAQGHTSLEGNNLEVADGGALCRQNGCTEAARVEAVSSGDGT